ncbi:MAG: YlxR family protein [Bacillota bacterium]|jgi:predicted RNA-binding protein YlxR (DUF448 family)|nr:YlxR family protein [Bacillota bacterium]
MMRKIPMRKCVVTQEQLPKKELLRVVRTPEREVVVDLKGKMNGRGAYLKKDISVVDLAKKKGSLEKALNVKINDEVYESIKQAILNG